jgi:hypothetical protein
LDPGGRGWRIQAFTQKLEIMGKNKNLKIKDNNYSNGLQKTITLKKYSHLNRKTLTLSLTKSSL